MKKIIFVIILIIVVVGAGIFITKRDRDNTTREPTFTAMPELTLKDYSGNTVALADFKGTPLVINSWAVWCPFCLRELPDFAEVQKEFGEQVIIIAIDRVESLKTAKSYTDDLGITDDLIFLLDSKDEFYRSIGGFSMPETIFVDSNGIIKEHKRGFMRIEDIRQKINNLLSLESNT